MTEVFNPHEHVVLQPDGSALIPAAVLPQYTAFLDSVAKHVIEQQARMDKLSTELMFRKARLDAIDKQLPALWKIVDQYVGHVTDCDYNDDDAECDCDYRDTAEPALEAIKAELGGA